MITSSANSGYLKTLALCWLRYGKKMPIVCTECGSWNADVMGVSPTTAIEVETKISKNDLKAEFRNKTAKHFTYQNVKEGVSVPNYFYILVPECLKDEAVAIASEGNSKAGVITCESGVPEWTFYDRSMISVAKKAQKLKDTPPSRRLIMSAMMRATSELCGTHLALRSMEMNFTNTIEHLRTNVVKAAFRSSGGTDFEEDEEKQFAAVAQELAFCVEGLDPERFHWLEPAQKEKWMKAARAFLESKISSTKGWENASFH